MSSIPRFWHADVGVQVVEAYAPVVDAECPTDAAMYVELLRELPSAATQVPSLCHEVAHDDAVEVDIVLTEEVEFGNCSGDTSLPTSTPSQVYASSGDVLLFCRGLPTLPLPFAAALSYD